MKAQTLTAVISLLLLITVSCKEEVPPIATVEDLLSKELPLKTWVTKKYPMKVKGEYQQLVKNGVVQAINFYDNTSFYKPTQKGWSLIANFKEEQYQGNEEAEVNAHYFSGFVVKDLKLNGDELTASVDLAFATTEFSGDAKGVLNAENQVCYATNAKRSVSVQLRKSTDGWQIDSVAKSNLLKTIQEGDSLSPATFDFPAICIPQIKIKSYLVYDDDGSFSDFDPLMENNFNGIKPHNNVKVVIIGNMADVAFSVFNVDAGEPVIDKHFDLKDSAEFVFPGMCEQLKLNLKSGNGKILYSDFMMFSCGG